MPLLTVWQQHGDCQSSAMRRPRGLRINTATVSGEDTATRGWTGHCHATVSIPLHCHCLQTDLVDHAGYCNDKDDFQWTKEGCLNTHYNTLVSI